MVKREVSFKQYNDFFLNGIYLQSSKAKLDVLAQCVYNERAAYVSGTCAMEELQKRVS